MSLPKTNIKTDKCTAAMVSRNQRVAADYRDLSLVEIVERIVHNADRKALYEIHENRYLPSDDGAPRERIVEHVYRLYTEALEGRRYGAGASDIALEEAYCKTVDMLSNIPDSDTEPSRVNSRPHGRGKRKGPDSRLYLTAFLQRIQRIKKDKPNMTHIEEEILTARELRRFIYTLYYRSIEEAKRSMLSTSRYAWHVKGGGTILLWFPRGFAGKRRRIWLETQVTDPDPRRPNEQERVQQLVDRLLVKEKTVLLDAETVPAPGASPNDFFLPWAVLYGFSVEGLAEVVAREKAGRIERLRPSIRALGPAGVRRLIHCIFDALVCEDRSAAQIAAAFHLSESALSRFAASRWRAKDADGPESPVPPLWVNVARVLAYPAFREAAIAAGVWPKVKAVAERAKQRSPEVS